MISPANDVIRHATPADMPALLALQAECYPPELRDDTADVAACIVDTTVAAHPSDGIVGAVVVRGEMLYSVEVARAWRRRGIARSLVRVAESHGAQFAAALPDGRMLLASCGWVDTGERREIEGHEAWMMSVPGVALWRGAFPGRERR